VSLSQGCQLIEADTTPMIIQEEICMNSKKEKEAKKRIEKFYEDLEKRKNLSSKIWMGKQIQFDPNETLEDR
jgi:hypothetical protein